MYTGWGENKILMGYRSMLYPGKLNRSAYYIIVHDEEIAKGHIHYLYHSLTVHLHFRIKQYFCNIEKSHYLVRICGLSGPINLRITASDLRTSIC